MSPSDLTLLILLVAHVHVCCGKSYDAYCLYSVLPDQFRQVSFLQDLKSRKELNLIFLASPKMERVPILVNRLDEKEFLNRLANYEIKSKLVFDRVQEALEEQLKQPLRSASNLSIWDSINTLDKIYNWLHYMAERYSKKGMILDSIGKSEEDREIYVVSIKANAKIKPKVILEAGIHGNEWISISVATYMINELLNTTYGPLKLLKDMYDWYIIPLLNPDGYDYCLKWVASSGDASSETASAYYHGPNPFSEAESKALRNFIRRQNENVTFYFSFHGFGQRFIVPYMDNVKHFKDMANRAEKAAATILSYSNLVYKIRPQENVSSDSLSWVQKTLNIPYAYTILSRDDGYYGPLMPTIEIKPACQEMMMGLVELIKTPPLQISRTPIALTSTPVALKRGYFAKLNVLLLIYVFIIMVIKIVF